MSKKNISKAREGSVLLRGGEELKLEKAPGQFTARFKDDADVAVKPSLGKAKQKEELFGKIRLFEVAEDDLNDVMKDVRKDHDSMFCHHVYYVEGDEKNPVQLTDQIIVQFLAEVSSGQITAILEKYGLEIVEEFDDCENNFIVRVTPDSGANPVKISNRLHAEGLTEYAEPNLLVRHQRCFEPSDSRFRKQWHLKNRGGVELLEGADVNAPEAWDVTTGSRGITVAVIDDGFDLDHPDLQGEGKIVAPMDFSFRRPPVLSDPDPEVITDTRPFPEGEDYHGTPCAGVAIAELGRGKVVGIAPGCSFMPIRWPFMSTDGMVSAMFTHAYQSGAAVISCSWGPGKGVRVIGSKFRQVLADAASKGRGGKGCLIFFAAGNDNIPLNDFLNGKRHFNGEACHPDVIAVSACTSMNRKAAYSGWGKEVSVCAPSNNFWPGDSGRKLPGRGIVTTDNGNFGSGFDRGIYTERFGGTSSATPLAAGVAALVLSANPALTAVQVREILESTADKIEDPNPDPELNLTKGTYDENGHSEWFGYGKLNAAKAVRKARGLAGAGTKTVRVKRAEDLDIPDADPAGIVSRISVNEDAPIRDLKVMVDIRHPFIGDLTVTLIAPSGTRFPLHNRMGSSNHDIFKVFDFDNTPGLKSLTGTGIKGVWTLEVADHARWDEGTLRQWELEAQVEDDGSIHVESSNTQLIPDNDPTGISDRLIVAASKNISMIRVTLDITHTWIGDLVVSLTGPSGTKAVLHDRTGSSMHHIQREYTGADAPGLNDFLGQDARGQWVLSVSDHAGRDTGKLNRWELKIV
jgi:subtilisin-like proprotein convertase family protein